MNRSLLLLPLAVILAFCTVGHGGPLKPFESITTEIPPLASRVYVVEYKGGEPAHAVGISKGKTCVGMYVYDKYGNCVAWDDEANHQNYDNLAVSWLPSRTDSFVVEWHNGGLLPNELLLNAGTPLIRDSEEPALPRLNSREAVHLEIGETHQFHQTFPGNQRACVIVEGDHYPVTNLEIKVFDGAGSMVASSAAKGDIVAVAWYPPMTQDYRITVTCDGEDYNDLMIVVK